MQIPDEIRVPRLILRQQVTEGQGVLSGWGFTRKRRSPGGKDGDDAEPHHPQGNWAGL